MKLKDLRANYALKERRRYSSRSEDYAFKILKEAFPNEKIERNVRPDWIRSPKTGRNLELDIFIPSQNLAVEVQGFHHGTLYQEYKDGIKKQCCLERGVQFILVDASKKGLERLAKRFKIKMKIKLSNNFSNKSRYAKKTRYQLWKERGWREQQAEIEANLRRMKAREEAG